MDASAFMLAVLWFLGLVAIGHSVTSLLSLNSLERMQRLSLNYWIGYVVYGWVLFFPAAMQKLDVNASLYVFALAIPGALMVLKRTRKEKYVHFDKGHLFAVLLLGVALINLSGAAVPPTEADSLAYHFYLPKTFVEHGGLFFQPNAIEMVSAFLGHMVSTGAYAAGGESLMLLHAWTSSLMAGVAAYALARRRLRPAASWVFAALVYTVPAMTYAATNGIVEPRLMGVTCAAVLAFIYYARSERASWLIVTALLLGGALAMKYFAMFLVAAFGIAFFFAIKCMEWKKIIPHVILFGLVVLLFGSQWYGWNYIHTGDPVFPSLYSLMGHTGWSAEQARYFSEHFLAGEKMIDRTTMNFMWHYPVDVTLNGGQFDSGRTGLGALFLIALVPSVFWFCKRFPFMTWDKHVGVLEFCILIFLVYYALFFFMGPSGRIRHLLPVLPLLMLPAWVWGQKIFALARGGERFLLATGVAAVLVVQAGVVVLANKSAASVWFKYADKESYLVSNAYGYELADMVNKNLTQEDKVLVTSPRTLNYYLDIPSLYAPGRFQEIVPLGHGTTTGVLNALWREEVTHWLTVNDAFDSKNDSFDNGHHMIRRLTKLGCLKQVGEREGYLPTSRTVDTLGGSYVTYYVHKVIPYCAG